MRLCFYLGRWACDPALWRQASLYCTIMCDSGQTVRPYLESLWATHWWDESCLPEAAVGDEGRRMVLLGIVPKLYHHNALSASHRAVSPRTLKVVEDVGGELVVGGNGSVGPDAAKSW